LTRDGVPIVLHDESLARTTNVAVRFAGDARGQDGYRVSDFDLAEVRTLDAGSWFVAPEGGRRSARGFGSLHQLDRTWVEQLSSGGVVVPTLAEALELTRELDWLVNVEIKSFPDRPSGLVDRVLEVITATETGTRVLISSFDHGDLVEANRPGREYALGVLTASRLHRLQGYAAEIVGADAVHVSAAVMGSETIAYRRDRRAQWLDATLRTNLTARGLPLLVYTVNSHGPSSVAEHLAEIGVDGLFTDDPRGMRPSLELGSATGRQKDHPTAISGPSTTGD
jgi:glycerophosphoryl diester phosphodiesterase